MVEKRLGRGLDFLLSEAPTAGRGDEVAQLEITSLIPSPYQPRVEFTAIPYYAWDHRDPGAMMVWIPAHAPD